MERKKPPAMSGATAVPCAKLIVLRGRVVLPIEVKSPVACPPESAGSRVPEAEKVHSRERESTATAPEKGSTARPSTWPPSCSSGPCLPAMRAG
jgi:hypothetical protein